MAVAGCFCAKCAQLGGGRWQRWPAAQQAAARATPSTDCSASSLSHTPAPFVVLLAFPLLSFSARPPAGPFHAQRAGRR